MKLDGWDVVGTATTDTGEEVLFLCRGEGRHLVVLDGEEPIHGIVPCDCTEARR